ncbi:MAG: YitT family protein [Lachnospiraceae bacterium]|nr:YitT family protein [Lachnospiraceae bacterium]
MYTKLKKFVNKRRSTRLLAEYILITVASFIYAVAVSLFLDPNNLAPGGITGLAVILSAVTIIPTGMWYLIMNIPVMILGLWKLGWKVIVSTLYSILLISWFTDLIAVIPPVTTDPLAAALTGAALQAISLAAIFKAGATTGGTDIIVKVLRLRYKHIKTGMLLFLLDLVVVVTSGVVFKDFNTALYAMIVVVLTSFLIDLVLYGRDGAKMVYIISDAPEAITKRILEELDVGVTYIQGQGAYSRKDKRVILCVLRKQMYPKAEEIVKEEDPEAFLIVTDATEIYGEGYKSYFAPKL